MIRSPGQWVRCPTAIQGDADDLLEKRGALGQHHRGKVPSRRLAGMHLVLEDRWSTASLGGLAARERERVGHRHRYRFHVPVPWLCLRKQSLHPATGQCRGKRDPERRAGACGTCWPTCTSRLRSLPAGTRMRTIARSVGPAAWRPMRAWTKPGSAVPWKWPLGT